MRVDSYCEFLLPASLGEEAARPLLDRMSILIEDFYAPVTEYSEEDFRRGRALLLLVKEFCLNDKCLSGLQMAEDFKLYWDKTLAMLEQELTRLGEDGKPEAPKEKQAAGKKAAAVPEAEENAAPALPDADYDKAMAIVGNALQLLSSVCATLTSLKAEADKQPRPQVLGIPLPGIAMPFAAKPNTVTFARKSPALEDVVGYLREFWHYDDDYNENRRRVQGVENWAKLKYLFDCLTYTADRMKELEVL